MAETLQNSTDAGRSVEVVCFGDEWLVRIVDNGRQTTQRFAVASHARAFADGQKIRLGLGEAGATESKQQLKSGGPH